MTTCRDCAQPTGKRYAQYCADCRWRHRGKPATYVLTPERRTYLQAHYKPSERGTSQRCAMVLQVPKWRVCRWAAELGLTNGVQGNLRPWTADEDAFLERHILKRTVNWIAMQLGRSLTAVHVRAKRLRLSRLPDGYSQTDVALGFGVSRDTVEAWQRRGWLRPVTARADGQAYRFTEDAILRFVKERPTAFTLAKVDQVWFLGLVFGDVGERRTDHAA